MKTFISWFLYLSFFAAASFAQSAGNGAAPKNQQPSSAAIQKDVSPPKTPAQDNHGATAVASKAPAPDYANQAVVIERMTMKLTFENDGNGTREVSTAARVQSQSGVQALAVLTFAYLSANENVEIDYVRVRKPDGSVVTTPDYNVLDMPAEVTRVAPMYSDIHEKHVTVKALDVGDVLEYVVRFRTLKPQIPGQFWFEYSFPTDTVVRDFELRVAVPRDRYVKVVSPAYTPQVREDGTHRIYEWKTSNLEVKPPQQLRESPPPDVELTTFRNWDEVGRWYDELQTPQVAVNAKLQAKAVELTKGLITDDEKIRALYNFVSTRFHYVSLSFGAGRYQPHAAEDVLENGYGDCKDKHTLLAALLSSVGIEVWPVAINATRKTDPEVPSPGQFDHVITYVPHNGAPIWLDTTAEVAPFGMLLPNLRDKQALVIPKGKPAELKKTPANPPFPTAINFTAEGKLSPDDVFTGHFAESMRGDTEIIYRLAFRNTSEAQWKELAQKIAALQGFGGEVSNVSAASPESTNKPFEFSYDYTRKEYGGDWENHRVIAPLPPLGVESAANQDKKPSEAVFLGAPGEVVYTAKIELPVHVIKLPSDVKLTEPWADFQSQYAADGTSLTVTRRMIIKQDSVPLAQWEEYKKFAKAVLDDWGAWIELYSVAGNTSTSDDLGSDLPDFSPYTQGKLKEAQAAFQRNDLSTAESILRELLQKDPKAQGVHALLGLIYARRNLSDEAGAQFIKEEELHPDNTNMCRVLGSFYLSQKKNALAEEQFRKWLAVDDRNYDAMLGLDQALIREKKYDDSVKLWEKAHALLPERADVSYSLGLTYLHTNHPDKGMPLLEKQLASETSPMAFNNIAYELADQNVSLDKAGQWGDRALEGVAAASLKTGTEEDALNNTRSLGAVWDTVGWIYFRRGELDKAERYLKAAFSLTQDSIVGDHLAQLFEKMGKKEKAEHYYLLAIAAPDHNDKAPIREHYKKLTGKEPVTVFLLPRRQSTAQSNSTRPTYPPGEELSRDRLYTIPHTSHQSGNATFSIVFSPGKIEQATFISGDDNLRSADKSIVASNIRAEFPDTSAVRITRLGILICGGVRCDIVLLPPNSARVSD